MVSTLAHKQRIIEKFHNIKFLKGIISMIITFLIVIRAPKLLKQPKWY